MALEHRVVVTSKPPAEIDAFPSKRFAGLIGPTLTVLVLSEVVAPRIWESVPTTQIYLAGTLWFVAGLSIVRAHNRWVRGWPIAVTIVGWFALLGGLFRMFGSEFAKKNAPGPVALVALQVVLLATGVFLTFKAYARSGHSKPVAAR